VPLGAWVVGEACRQTAAWHLVRTEAGQDDGRLNISVNVSAQQIADPSFPGQVAAALDESGLNPDKLWLEITESTLMGNGDLVIATLTSLRDLGLHLEIDDFGTGYSSLSYLKRLPIETLKVDRSFIDELDSNVEDVAIVRAIIALGESLGLSVMAEGVERHSQAVQLQTLNCYLAQGFFFGVPLAADAIGPFPLTISKAGSRHSIHNLSCCRQGAIARPCRCRYDWVRPAGRRGTMSSPVPPDTDRASTGGSSEDGA